MGTSFILIGLITFCTTVTLGRATTDATVSADSTTTSESESQTTGTTAVPTETVQSTTSDVQTPTVAEGPSVTTGQSQVAAVPLTLPEGDDEVFSNCKHGDTGKCVDSTTQTVENSTNTGGETRDTISTSLPTSGAKASDATSETPPDVGTNAIVETMGNETSSDVNASTVLPPGEENLNTTEVSPPDVQTTMEAVVPIIPSAWPADDPCNPANHILLTDEWRHYSRKMLKRTEPRSDSELVSGWYGFDYNNLAAIITTSCIKEEQCSTIMPYYYTGPAVVPAVGEQVDNGTLCGPGKVAGEINCCLKPIEIQVRNCSTRLIYYLHKLALSSAAICTQLADEVVDVKYLAFPPKSTTAPPTTEASHAQTLSWVESQTDTGIVTVEYKFPQAKQEKKDYLVNTFDMNYRTMVATELNKLDETSKPKQVEVDPDAGQNLLDLTGRKRREAGQHSYKPEDVKYIKSPSVSGETLQAPIFVEEAEGQRVPAKRIMAALKIADESGTISKNVGLVMTDYYIGRPNVVTLAGPPTNSGTWARYRGLLIALIILISLCLLIILIGLCCLKWRKSRGSWNRADDKVAIETGNGRHYNGKKGLLVHENPLPDSEIMRDEANMLEHDNPAMTSNGGGGHLSKNEHDNWVVPMDKLTKAQQEQPEIEDTKL